MAAAKKKNGERGKEGARAGADVKPRGKSICIVCEQEREGAPVRDDAVITSLRRLKGMIGIARNNRLFVCGECMPKYREKRSRFEKTLVQYVAVAALIIVLLAVVPLLLGAQFRLETVLLGIVMGAFITALSIFSYVPALAGEEKA